MPNELIQVAFNNRLLRSPEEVKNFDDALGAYAKRLSAGDLPDLYSVLDDATENHEVMFGLVHLIEDFEPLPSFRAFLAAIPRMKLNASHWVETLVLRIFNDDQTRDMFLAELHSAPEESRAQVLAIARKFAENTRPRLQQLRTRCQSVLASFE